MISNDACESVLIVAAEASSTLYAKRILEAWKLQGKPVKAFGIGDQSMVDLGFEAIGRSEDLAVVGIQEVIAHWSDIKKTFHGILDEAAKRKPKFALLLDYPGFNLRLAKKLKKMNIPVVYYISPQIWAWRQGRVKEMKKTVDKVLTIFPFENQFYEKHGVDVEFVGHPLIDEVERMDFSETRREQLRSENGFKKQDTVVGIMPGSRKSELKHHLAVQIQTIQQLKKQKPEAKPVLLLAPGLTEEKLKEFGWSQETGIPVVSGEPFSMISICDFILCASGTATLMVGLMKKPMVVMYRMNSITAFLARRLVGADKSFAMVNLILGEKVVSECFQEEASPQNMSQLLQSLMQEETSQEMRERLEDVKTQLGSAGATERVVQCLESYF